MLSSLTTLTQQIRWYLSLNLPLWRVRVSTIGLITTETLDARGVCSVTMELILSAQFSRRKPHVLDSKRCSNREWRTRKEDCCQMASTTAVTSWCTRTLLRNQLRMGRFTAKDLRICLWRTHVYLNMSSSLWKGMPSKLYRISLTEKRCLKLMAVIGMLH